MTDEKRKKLKAARDAFIQALFDDDEKPWHVADANDRYLSDDIYNVDGRFNIITVLEKAIDAYEAAK